MRQLVLIALKLTVSVALLYFAISRLNLASLGDRLNHMELGWVAAALALALLQTGVSAIRWREVALACGAALAPRQALRFNLIASFFNQGLPSTVGGDAARIWLLARTGAGWWKATCSVLLDRFIGVLALTTLVAVSLYWSFGLIQESGRPVDAGCHRSRRAVGRCGVSGAGALAMARAVDADETTGRDGCARPDHVVLGKQWPADRRPVATDPVHDGVDRVEPGARGRGAI